MLSCIQLAAQSSISCEFSPGFMQLGPENLQEPETAHPEYFLPGFAESQRQTLGQMP